MRTPFSRRYIYIYMSEFDDLFVIQLRSDNLSQRWKTGNKLENLDVKQIMNLVYQPVNTLSTGSSVSIST